MKTFIFSALALGFLAGCSGSEIDGVVDNGEPVAIQLSAGIQATVISRAAVNPGEALTGVQFVKLDGESLEWNTVSDVTSVGNIAATTGTVAFDSPLYYPTLGTKTNIMAFYPAATISAGSASMTITGEEDVMYASPISGSKTAPMSNLSLLHKLTQIKFIVARNNTTDSDIENVTIKVKNANSKFDMSLTDGTLSGWGTPISMATEVTDATATESGSTVSAGTMLEPDQSSITLIVNATEYPVDTEVTIAGTDAGKFAVGKAYTITLTFSKKQIVPSATIAEWTAGTPGGGTIE